MSAAFESHRPIHYGPRRHISAIRERLDALSFEDFEVVPQSPCLGAEIRGVDLGKPMDEALAAEVERALVEYKGEKKELTIYNGFGSKPLLPKKPKTPKKTAAPAKKTPAGTPKQTPAAPNEAPAKTPAKTPTAATPKATTNTTTKKPSEPTARPSAERKS